MAQTATNPDTGETLVLIGDEWKKPEQSATSPNGDRAFLVDGQWVTTTGGAAVGNPNIQRQGSRSVRPDVQFGSTIGAIGGAGVLGAGIGAIGGDILQGIGRVAGAIPQGRVIGPALENTGRLISANRGQAAISGGLGGLTGESAGQIVEHSGGPQWAAETARFVGGAVGPELAGLAKDVLQKYVVTPSLSVISKAKKEAAKALLTKLEGGELKTLSEQEAVYLNQLRDELRGGPKSDASLESVGLSMGQEADDVLRRSQNLTRSAETAAQNVSPVTQRPMRESADIGGELNAEINKKFAAELAARDRSYKANQAARDAVVGSKEKGGIFVNATPEYQALVEGLKAELQPGKHERGVREGLEKILNNLTNPETDVFGQAKPITFQALDELRRKLGMAYRGKPAEGYEAIGEGMARKIYKDVSNIQEQFAGPVQRKMLDDYAARTEGMEVFHSLRGRKATALDRYDPTQFATDPSSLPSTYFKTRASVDALKELTGNVTLVNRAAIDHAAKEIENLSGPQVRKWMQSNSEWLGEVPRVRALVDRYATRLEGAERGLENAKAFATAAAKDANLLRGGALPAQRAVDLIKSGTPELWEKAGPAIANSPQAKQTLMNAARQVLADEATSAGVINFFNRNLRPALERSNVTNAAELDFIAQKLSQIKNLQLPEKEILGWQKRMLLDGIASWAATGGSRLGVEWSRSMIVPD